MKENIKLIIPVSIIIIVLGILFVAGLLQGRIKPNPAGTTGNHAGNLNNNGCFVEHDGTVYFANAYADMSLYAMSPDESDIRWINDSTVSHLLAGGSYLYFYQTGAAGSSGLGSVRGAHCYNRCTLNGKNMAVLYRGTILAAQLVDNTLYLLAAGEQKPDFFRMKTDKSDQTALAQEYINPACVRDGIIYYTEAADGHSLHALDTRNDSTYPVLAGSLWNPVLEGDYVYYMDVENDYRLCRYSFTENTTYVLTDDRVDCFNLGNGYVYYQKNGDAPQLICMRADGSDPVVLAEGNYTNISITSQYVYFQRFADQTSWYHSPLGSSWYEEFTAAAAAVRQSDK